MASRILIKKEAANKSSLYGGIMNYFDVCVILQVIFSIAYLIFCFLSIQNIGKPNENMYMVAMVIFCILGFTDFIFIVGPAFFWISCYQNCYQLTLYTATNTSWNVEFPMFLEHQRFKKYIL